LSDTALTDAGLEQLSALPRLGRLRLSGTRVTDAGLKYIKGLPRLENVDLRGTAVSWNGMNDLEVMPSGGRRFVMGRMRLPGKPLWRPGPREIAQAADQCEIEAMRQVGRFRGKLTIGPITWCGNAKSSAMVSNSGGTSPSDGGVEARAWGVELDGADLTDAELERLVGYLSPVKKVELLSLENEWLTNSGLNCLARLPELRYLDLVSTRVTDAGLEHISRLAKLQYVDLSGTRVTDQGIESIRALTQLRSLHLRNTAITDAGLDRLESLKELQWLSVEGTSVTGEGVTRFQRALPKCNVSH
jgi:hypothetical protein